MEDKLIIAAINAGAGTAIAALIIYLSYKIACKFISQLNEMAGKFLSGTNEALNRQAMAMEGITESIKEFVERDNTEHKEIIIMLKLIWEKIGKKEAASGS